MAHFTTKSVKKAIKIALFVIPFLVILIITNGVVSDGHLVDYDDFVTGASVPSFHDYVMEDSHFYVTGDDPYITFYHDAACREFTLFFNEAYDKDLEVPVWFMSNDGEIYDTTTVTWKAGSRLLTVDVPDDRVMLISMGIDRDMSIYHIMSSNPYHTYKWKAFCFFTLTTLLLIVYGLLYKFGLLEKLVSRWTKVIRKKYKYYKDRKGAFIKSVLVRVVIIFGSIVMSILLFYILSQLKVRYNNEFIRFNEKTVAFGAIVIGYIQFVIVYRRNIAKRFPIFTFFTILAVGAAFVIGLNGCVGISWDEHIHYSDALKLSHCFDAKQNIAEWVMTLAFAWYPWSKADCTSLFQWFEELYNGNLVYTLNHYHVSLIKLVYLPYTFGLWFARGLKLPLHIVMGVASYFGVIFYAVIGYFASKRLKYGRIVLFLLALMPTNMFLASNFSYDIWVTGWAMLGYSCLFSELQKRDEAMTDWTMILIPLCFALVPLRKYVYFVLTLPAFFVGASKFKTTARKWIYRVLILITVGAPFIVIMINNIINAGEGDKRGGEAVNSAEQIKYIIANPGAFVNTLLVFLKTYLNPFALNRYNTPIDNFAYAGTIGLGATIIVFIIVCSLVSHEDSVTYSLAELKKSKGKLFLRNVFGNFPWWYRLGMIAVYIGTGAICAVAMYISFNPVGATGIGGCQGRYIIPALFPTLYVLTRIPVKSYVLNKVKDYNFYALVGGIMFLINTYGIWKLMICYY